MSLSLLRSLATGAAAIAAVATLSPPSALADFDRPKKIDCTKAANKNKPACKPHDGPMSDDEIYNAAYWMARKGAYADALALIERAANPDDPRLLNAKGYATRKLGNIEAALPLYARSLEIDPDNTRVREYLGEALLTKGDLAGARAQLQEIETRCGATCSGYAELVREIAAYESKLTAGG
jgi:Flp pilus assembly protein TadD